MKLYSVMNPNYQRGDKTEVMGIDCEFVKSGSTDLLARVSIVNYYGQIVLDTLVSNDLEVTDYLTHITGITSHMLEGAPSYEVVNGEVMETLFGATIIGHSLHCDLEKFSSVTLFPMPFYYRDVSEFSLYLREREQKCKLKDLTQIHLNGVIQEGVHSSVIDARAAMALYRINRKLMDKTHPQTYFVPSF